MSRQLDFLIAKYVMEWKDGRDDLLYAIGQLKIPSYSSSHRAVIEVKRKIADRIQASNNRKEISDIIDKYESYFLGNNLGIVNRTPRDICIAALQTVDRIFIRLEDRFDN